MSIEWITVLFFGGMLVILLTGLPIAFGLGGLGMAFALWLWGPESAGMALFGTMAIVRYTLMVCVPLFVFMGMMLYHSGIAEDLYTMMRYWLAPVPGSLAVGTVGVSTIFAALVGSEEPATLTMGSIALPLMLKNKYGKGIAIGCIQAGGALGFLIPPSIIAILYALVARESVGMLFAGGLLPGLMLSSLFIIYIIGRCSLQPHLGPPIPKAERPSWGVKIKSLRASLMPILIMLSVIGTIFAGLATPVEAAAVGALGSMICVAIKRRLTFKIVQESLITALRLTTMMMWIFMAALTFGKVYGALGAKEVIETIMTGLPVGPWGTIVMIQFTFFILGMFLDDTAILFITMPIYIPIIKALGFDPIWFGVLYLVNMQMAYLTPPFGYCLFLMKGVVPKNITMGDIYRSVWPFVTIQGLAVIILMIFPQLATWLPYRLFGVG